MKVKAISDGQVVNLLLGLEESPNEGLHPTLARGWIATAVDLLQEYLKEKMPSVGFTGQFPRYDSNKQQPEQYIGSLNLPMCVIRLMAGPSMDWVGQAVWQDSKYNYFGYWQVAYIMLDVWARTGLEADMVVAAVEQAILLEGKRGPLLVRGFQNFWSEYSSRSQVGAEYWRSFLYEPSFVTQPMVRHLMYIRTRFEVIWKTGTGAYGVITQIALGSSNEYDFSTTIGERMDRLYLEDYYFNWFDIGIEG